MFSVKTVQSKKDFRRFTRFKNKLYANHKYAVPTLESDERATLDATKNPAMEFCERQCFLAYNHKGKIVGRICAIINHKANTTWGHKYGRFGFFDFIEDIEVARLLLQAAEEWVMARGMNGIQGPLGFTDMDEEGMLVEGFEELGTMITLYNYPYYNDYMQQLGYQKDADWIEMLLDIESKVPERFAKFSKIIQSRYNLRILHPNSSKELIRDGWASQVFELINKEYAKLYGYTAMTPRQIEQYVKTYIPIIRLDLICLVVDKSDKVVGFGISLPSLSRALQKGRGRMLPFGWFHLLRALKAKRVEVVDLMLIAIDNDYKNLGITSIIINHILEGMVKLGVRYAETNPELETNTTIHQQWSSFSYRQHKRRRCYIKEFL